MAYYSLIKGFNTFSELRTQVEIFLRILSPLKHFQRLQLFVSDTDKDITKKSSFPFAIFTEFDNDLDTFKEHEAFKFHIIICVEFCRQT